MQLNSNYSGACYLLPQKNRTLVILNGLPRCGDPAWNSLYMQLLDVNNADLALAFGESLDWNSSLYSRAKYIWEFPELEDWGVALDQMGTGWRRYRDSGNVMGGVRGSNGKITYGSGAILFWIRWFVKGKLVSEPGLLDQYDWFVYTRSDHFYYCPHDLKPFKNNSNSLYVPQGEGYGGYIDRHLVASCEHILPALSIFDDIARTDNPDKMQEGNMEQLIERRWRDMNLIVVLFPQMFFTCAKPGDKTHWIFGGDIQNTPNHIKELGIAVKYTQEYVDSANYCHEHKLDPTTSTPTDATSAAAAPLPAPVPTSLDKSTLHKIGCFLGLQTESPTSYPTAMPTTAKPTTATPTDTPTMTPTNSPTEVPTKVPTAAPTGIPTDAPTSSPLPLI